MSGEQTESDLGKSFEIGSRGFIIGFQVWASGYPVRTMSGAYFVFAG